ncbi:hypothetical protein B0H10DRAFT_2068799 [Mycena sp. CBHHK59/15]|nr:hypothetical protein B0H10DRAFT_2068799 [Mycena sp. CBHHK59/15]
MFGGRQLLYDCTSTPAVQPTPMSRTPHKPCQPASQPTRIPPTRVHPTRVLALVLPLFLSSPPRCPTRHCALLRVWLYLAPLDYVTLLCYVSTYFLTYVQLSDKLRLLAVSGTG